MLDRIKKSTEHVVGITVLFYVLGFLVSTVYLCSLGVVWFDAIKPRYIVIGLLFSLFIMSFLLPLNVLRKHLVRGEIAKNFLLLLGVSLVAAIAIFSLVWFIENSLRTSVRADILITEPPTYNKAFADAPNHFRSFFFGSFFLLVLSIVLACMLIIYLLTRKKSKETVTQFLKGTIPFLVAMISYGVLVEILELYRKLGPKEVGMEKGWSLFFVVSLMTYAIGAIFLFWAHVHKPVANKESATPEPPTPVLDWSLSWIHMLWLSSYVAPILPVYATVVYPRILQGLGGGAPVMVQLSGTDEKERPWTDNDSTYIIERNDKDTLLLVKSAADGRIRIIEVATSKLGTLEYQDPASSEAAR